MNPRTIYSRHEVIFTLVLLAVVERNQLIYV